MQPPKKHGIQDEDTYNFDETGFMMGRAKVQTVFEGSKNPIAPKRLQSGNLEWTVVIQGARAAV